MKRTKTPLNNVPARRDSAGDGSSAPTIETPGFGGVGRSVQGDLSPVSERHDEALAEALALRLQPSRRKHGVKE